jgi:CheY-like chemotaxis protein
MASGLDLAGRPILVVEDEPLIRLDLTGRLQDAGATVFAAARLDRALDLAGHPNISAGVLDFDLGSADSTPVCWKLIDRGIPFVFHTGLVYSAFRQWPDAPVILKSSTRGLIGAVAGLFRAHAALHGRSPNT